MLPRIIKNKLRDLIQGNVIGPLQIELKTSPFCQVSQIALARKFAESPASFELAEVGFSVFSEFEEDGILLYLFAALGAGNRRLVEIGCGDGLQNNSTNLIVNHRWTGVLIDADASNIATANHFASVRNTRECELPLGRLRHYRQRGRSAVYRHRYRRFVGIGSARCRSAQGNSGGNQCTLGSERINDNAP